MAVRSAGHRRANLLMDQCDDPASQQLVEKGVGRLMRGALYRRNSPPEDTGYQDGPIRLGRLRKSPRIVRESKTVGFGALLLLFARAKSRALRAGGTRPAPV